MAEHTVETWNEFVEAIAEENATVNIENGAYFDFNEIAPIGLTSPITVNCAIINGNNAIIKNITNAQKTDIFYFQKNTAIYDLNIFNFCLKGKGEDYPLFFNVNDSNAEVTLRNCKISGILANSASLCFGKKCFRFYESSLNLRLNNGGVSYRKNSNSLIPGDYRIYCQNTLIHLIGTHKIGDCIPAFFIENSELSGNINLGEGAYSSLHVSGTNSKININLDNEHSIIPLSSGFGNYYDTTAIVVNIDKANITNSYANYYINANSAQIADAQYLTANGFTLGGV